MRKPVFEVARPSTGAIDTVTICKTICVAKNKDTDHTGQIRRLVFVCCQYMAKTDLSWRGSLKMQKSKLKSKKRMNEPELDKSNKITYEPCHEIMALVVLRKLILQTRMRSYPEGLDVWFWSDSSSTSILHVCGQRRLWRDCGCAGSPEPSLAAYVINT